MFGIMVNNIDEALGMMLIGAYFSYHESERPVDTDQLGQRFTEYLGSGLTSGALEEFESTMQSMGYRFYSPWEDHDGQFIIEPGKNFEAECERIMAEIDKDTPND